LWILAQGRLFLSLPLYVLETFIGAI
jgi:hypothetical protein